MPRIFLFVPRKHSVPYPDTRTSDLHELLMLRAGAGQQAVAGCAMGVFHVCILLNSRWSARRLSTFAYKPLSIAFAPICHHGNHLAVVIVGLPALRPRNDVVSLHLLDGQRLASYRALPTLALICPDPLPLVERSNVQVALVAVKHIGVNPFRVGHLPVSKQFGASLFNGRNIENVMPVLTVKRVLVHRLQG